MGVFLRVESLLQKRWFNIGLLLLWIGGVTFASLYKFESGGDLIAFKHKDKIAHFVFYMMFVLLFANLLCFLKVCRGVSFIVSVATAIIYGGAIELIQPYFGRTCSLADFVANSCGAVVGVAIFSYFSGRR